MRTGGSTFKIAGQLVLAVSGSLGKLSTRDLSFSSYGLSWVLRTNVPRERASKVEAIFLFYDLALEVT